VSAPQQLADQSLSDTTYHRIRCKTAEAPKQFLQVKCVFLKAKECQHYEEPAFFRMSEFRIRLEATNLESC
jgi:hypothetical protein